MSDAAMLDAHCLALGRLCVAWAFIDRQLNEVLMVTIGCSAAATACIATAADSVAARCNILRSLIYEKPISDEWNDAFKELLSKLESAGKIRNRMIHDRWEVLEQSLIRIDRRAFAKIMQARDRAKLKFDTEHLVKPREIDDLTETVGRMAFSLHCAQRDLEDLLHEGLRVTHPLLIRARDLQPIPDMLQLIAPSASRPQKP